MKRNQEQTVFNTISAAASRTEAIVMDEDVESGTLVITTDSTYNGTTGTVTMTASLDGTNYVPVFGDDNTTAFSHTLAASSGYQFLLKRVLFKFYRLIYTKGDASVGVITATFRGNKY